MPLTDYQTAAHWSQNLILCNKIADIDPSIYDNMRFNYYDENDNTRDIFQWFLTNLNEREVEWQEKIFPKLLYTYSDLLDCYVLCVDHYGTLWRGVETECSTDWAKLHPDKVIEED